MFYPQAQAIVRTFDARIRSKLAASLEHVVAKGLKASIDDSAIAKALEAIRAHRQKPGVFARYFDLVFAVKAERPDDAMRMVREICEICQAAPTLEVHPLTFAAMGDDAARFAKLLDTSPSGSAFAAPASEDWKDFDTRVFAAFRVLDAVDPALSEEVRALIVEVVGSVPSSAERSFGSASSLTLWGGIVMNLHRHETVLDVVDGLVHEAAHQMLFGHALDEPLLANAAKERYASPLRSDPRPMDGVFHATFVCARLHLLYSRLLAGRSNGSTQVLPEVDERELLDRQALQKRNFLDGAKTVADHGRPNAIGAAIMRATSAYMSHAAA